MSQTFEQWFAAVDQNVEAIIGLSVNDLEDCCFMDWYEDGVKPASAARKALRNSGGAF
jgi:hypothetical protein